LPSPSSPTTAAASALPLATADAVSAAPLCAAGSRCGGGVPFGVMGAAAAPEAAPVSAAGAAAAL
jgi:hypothetical protein